jgi:hypothetical protein
MARLQSLQQQHSLERSFAPTSSKSISGMSGTSEGVPRMHPLKSSLPSLKAASLIHGLKMKKFSMPKIKMAGMKLMKMPRLK